MGEPEVTSRLSWEPTKVGHGGPHVNGEPRIPKARRRCAALLDGCGESLSGPGPSCVKPDPAWRSGVDPWENGPFPLVERRFPWKRRDGVSSSSVFFFLQFSVVMLSLLFCVDCVSRTVPGPCMWDPGI